MKNLYVFIDVHSFASSAVSSDDLTAAIRTAVGIFNKTLLQDRCGIDGFAVVETDDETTADIVICKKHRTDLELHGNLSVELLPNISETDGKTIYLDTTEIFDVSGSYDKPIDEIVREVVCRELCHVLGVDGRIGLHPYGSKEYQKDFGLMLNPYSPYNGKLEKEYYLTDEEVAALKATVSSMVEH